MASEGYEEPMNLKVRELLKEVQLDYSPATTKTIDDVVSSIKQAIDKIPDNLQVTADEAPNFVRDIGADKVDFKFSKPDAIEIGGSYSYQCVAKPDVNIDLFIRLPKECFHEKDYLNHRYHAKRCLYLCIIEKHLKFSSLVQKVEWSTFQNEARKPILVVYPALKLVGVPEFSIRLIPSAKSLFSIKMLNIQRNNMRGLNQGQATPIYNSSILEDMFLEQNAEFVRKTFIGWTALGEALLLLKVWARQRSSLHTYDCLSGYIISIIMVFLATESSKKRINKSLTTMQIFRITLDFIATSKLWGTGIIFKPEGETRITKEDKKRYVDLFPAVICDPFAHFNMAFRMTKSSLLELREEAALAISCIDKCLDGGFVEIFMTKMDFPSKFDYCIRLNLKGNAEVYGSGFCLDNECWRLYELKVHSLLLRGLGSRIKCLRVTWRNAASIKDINNGLSGLDSEPLFIGISFSLPDAFNQFTKGPIPSKEDEALEFRKFWGDKAFDYLFHKGSIAMVAVDWALPNEKPLQRHLIMKRITAHLFGLHLFLPEEKILHAVDQLDFALVPANEDLSATSGELVEAFDNLAKRLRNMSDIPLKISSVQPLDPAFRGTSVFSPRTHPLAYENNVKRIKGSASTCIHPLEVMIQLESSGNWPMNDLAIEKTKTAFLLIIGERLQKSWRMKYAATEDAVDVFMSGFAFRLRILHDRGVSLLNGQSGSAQVKRVSSADRKLFLRNQHSSMINGLRGRYSAYGPVVRLAKRWVAAHLFSALFVEEAIELVVAYLFLKPLPFSTPSSQITGFLRFLRLLSEHDWTFSPLIVDINGDLTPADEKEINENFRLSRKAYQDGKGSEKSIMFLATIYDKSSEAWTSSSPSLVEIKRLAAYARSSSNLLIRLIMQDQLDSYGWECIFRTPLNNYDAVILLHRDKLSYPERLLFLSELNHGKLVVRGNASKKLQPFMSLRDVKGLKEEIEDKILIDFDPLRFFIKDLESGYPNIFKVWYDSIGGDAIGLTWNKDGLKKRGREDTDTDTDTDVKEDVVDVLKGVGQVGKGFVRSIYSLKVPRLSN